MTDDSDIDPASARPKLRNRVWVWRNGELLALHPAQRGEDEKYYLDDPRVAPSAQDEQS